MSTLDSRQTTTGDTALGILASVSFCHFLNDMIQSLLPATYPLLKESFHLDFAHVGIVTLENPSLAVFLSARCVSSSICWYRK